MNRTRPPARAQSLAQHLSRTLILAVVAVWLVSTGLVAWFVDRQIQHNFDVELVESTHRQLYPALLDLKLVRRATNLFDNRTLAIHPASTIFGPFTDEQRAAMDVLDTTIRISVGLEDMDDIIEDFRQAL